MNPSKYATLPIFADTQNNKKMRIILSTFLLWKIQGVHCNAIKREKELKKVINTLFSSLFLQ